MRKTKRNILLTAITALAFFLRLYSLGIVPASLEWDEVAIGYDAFSILKTGRDQFGTFLPLTFRSLDDWKPPLYEYLSVPSIAFFDLNAFSVRLPSALFGVTAVILTYFLTLEILKYTQVIDRLDQEKISLFSSLFLAISPWHLQFSRAAFEVNVAVTIVIAAILTFFLALKNQRFLLLSICLFSLSFFSYHSTRIVAPLLLISLIFLFRYTLLSFSKKILSLSFIIFFLTMVMLLPIVSSKEAQIRFTATNILSHRKVGDSLVPGIPEDRAAAKILIDEKAHGLESGKVVHNRRIAFLDDELIKIIAHNYFSHFDPGFLFIHADPHSPLHHAPGYGLLHPWDALFLFIGISIFALKFLRRGTLILLLWLIFAPIPAAVTWGVPHSVRTEHFMPVFHIFTAIGFVFFLRILKKESFNLSFFCALSACGFLLFYFFSYLHQYYIHTNYEAAKYWLYGRKEAALFADRIKNDYDQIIVSTRLEQPHAFFLFYLHYDPQRYLEEGGTVSGGFSENRNHFDKYYFKPIQEDIHNYPPKTLLIGTPQEFPSSIDPILTITAPNGEALIKILKL